MKFTVTTDQFNLGIMFLIWSIHKVTGNKEFYYDKTDSKKNIPNDPLINGTAHKMTTNSCSSLEAFESLLDRLPADQTMNHIKFIPEAESIQQYHDKNRRLQQLSKAKQIKVINITCRNLQHLIGFLRSHIEKPNWQNDMDMVKKHCERYWPRFFDNTEIYKDKLNTWHDIREGISFNVRPYDFWTHYEENEHNEMMYTCQVEDMILSGKEEITRICNFLGVNFNVEDVDEWGDIHNVWRKNLQHHIEFCNDIDSIVEAIVTNRQMDLSKYKLDVLKEAVLLHFLMFKHDLNLNTSTDKLPLNTKEIHGLLGKNIRTGIAKLYD